MNVPDTLKTLSFIEKDSKRFPNTGGWGYAQFQYDGPVLTRFSRSGTMPHAGTRATRL